MKLVPIDATTIYISLQSTGLLKLGFTPSGGGEAGIIQGSSEKFMFLALQEE